MSDDSVLNWSEIKEKFNNPFVVCIVFAAILTFPKEFYSILTIRDNWQSAMSEIDLFTKKFGEHFAGVLFFYYISPQIATIQSAIRRRFSQWVNQIVENQKYYSEEESRSFRQEFENLRSYINQEKSRTIDETNKYNAFRLGFIKMFGAPQNGPVCLRFYNFNSGKIGTPIVYNKFTGVVVEKEPFTANFNNECILINLGWDFQNYFLYLEISQSTISGELDLGETKLYSKIVDSTGRYDWSNVFWSRFEPIWSTVDKGQNSIRLRRTSHTITIRCNIVP